MAKNQQNGIAQNLESEATQNSQPNKLFIPGSKSIPGADPEQPSINNATRREEYNIGTRIDAADDGITNQMPHETPYSMRGNVPTYINTPTETPRQTNTSLIKEKTGTFATEGGDSALAYIKDVYAKKGIDGLKAIYGDINAQTYQNLLENLYAQGDLLNAQTGILNTQSPNVQAVLDLVDEVSMARALGYSDAKSIAEKLGQDERVIQKIMNNQAYELVQLNDEYKQRQLRQYYQAEEDLGTQIARNMEDYQNRQRNADYQFNSAIKTLERQLFDSEWAAKTTSAIYGMTGTKYMIDRIKVQYQQQMDDLNNTYQYKSATAQLSINRALEDFATSMERLGIEEDEAEKAYQAKVMETMTNLNNQVGLTIRQQQTILSNLQTTIAKMKSEGAASSLEALEKGYTTLSEQIAQAYGLSSLEIQGMGSYSPYNSGVEGDLRGKIGVGIADKTNNVGSIKVSATSKELLKLWDEAGIKYSNEGVSNSEGAFWTFETVQDGIKALELALKGRNGNATPAYLKQKGAWAMADLPGNLMNKKIKDMTSEEFNTLLRSIIKGENVQAYNLLKNGVGLGGEGAGTTGYDKNYAEEYKTYLSSSKGWDAFKKSTQDSLIQQFGSMDNFIKNAQAYSEEVVQPQQAKTFQESLDVVVEFNKAWNKLSDREKKTVKRLGVKDSYQNWLYNDDINNAVNLYRQIMGQGFVNTIIESKKAGASYGPLSDNEGNSIRDSFTALKLNAPEYAQTYIDYIIWDLSTAITELGQTPDTTRGLQRNVGNNIMNQNSQNEFNTPGSMNTGMNNTGTNYLGQQQSGLVTTGANQQWGQ